MPLRPQDLKNPNSVVHNLWGVVAAYFNAYVQNPPYPAGISASSGWREQREAGVPALVAANAAANAAVDTW
jgi:hypothetical protein